ncbi:MAG: hypothetical protein P8Y16_03120 [Sulfurimonas sp.]
MEWIHEDKLEYAFKEFSLIMGLSFLISIIFIASSIIHLEKGNSAGILFNTLVFVIASYFIYKVNKPIKELPSWIEVQGDALSVQITRRICSQRPFYPKIKYKYTLNDKSYISDRVFFQKCNAYYSEEEAKQMARDLIDRDRKVKCYVNPQNHEESILTKYVQPPSYLLYGIIIYFPSFISIIATYQ